MQNNKRYNFPSMFCSGKGQSLNSSYYHYLKGWAHCLDGEPIGELNFRTTDIDYTDWIVNITSETPDQVHNESIPRPHSHSHWRNVTVTRGSAVRTNCLATLDVKRKQNLLFMYILMFIQRMVSRFIFLKDHCLVQLKLMTNIVPETLSKLRV